MSKYFQDSEFECKCGCGLNNVNPRSREKLEDARLISDTSYVLTSACRCEIHNMNVGSSNTSSHVGSKNPSTAFDIRATNSRERYKILNGLIKAGFTRIGVAKTFIHCDDDETKSPEVTWVY